MGVYPANNQNELTEWQQGNAVPPIKDADFTVESNEIVRVPSTTVKIDDVAMARKVLNLMERLDDHDDVQSVSANFSIPDEAIEQLG